MRNQWKEKILHLYSRSKVQVAISRYKKKLFIQRQNNSLFLDQTFCTCCPWWEDDHYLLIDFQDHRPKVNVSMDIWYKFCIHLSHDERKNPIDIQGQGHNSQHIINLVTMIFSKPSHVFYPTWHTYHPWCETNTLILKSEVKVIW